MKKIIVLLFLIFIGTKLCSKPVGLANCGNTCFQNGFIQMLYQIDPLIDILSTPQNLFAPNTLGYTFQHLVWDIIEAQKTNKSVVIDCGSTQNPTNLKQLTEGVYSCMIKVSRAAHIGAQADLSQALKTFLEEIEKTPLKEFILTVSVEAIYPGNSELVAHPKFIPVFTMEDVTGRKSIKTYIKNIFISGQNPQSVESPKYKLFSLPKFMFFRHRSPESAPSHKNDYFPDQLDLTEYIKGDVQALYQLRAIGVRIGSTFGGGHWVTVVRDKDGKLYACNDSSIQQVNTWQEGIGTYIPMVFLYVLKTTIATTTIIPPTNTPQDSSDSKVLAAKLNKLQQSLQKVVPFLSKVETGPITPPLKPKTFVKPKITTYEELKKVIETAYEENKISKTYIAKKPTLLDSFEQTVAVTTAKYLVQELLKEGYTPEYLDYIPFIAYVTEQVTEQYPDKNINLHCLSLAAGKLDKELLLIRALRSVGYKTITLIAIDLEYHPNFVSNLQYNPPGKSFRDWFFDHKIDYSFDAKNPAVDGVTLQLFEDSYRYLQKFYTDNLPKNHLFLMIQPSNPVVLLKKENLIGFVESSRTTFNCLTFENRASKIEIYLPYKKSDFFVLSTATGIEAQIKKIKETIQNWQKLPSAPSYQGSLITTLIETFFDTIFPEKNKTDVYANSNVFLSFYELIRYTALDTSKPLAFEILFLKMKQITDMSGSLEQIYNRYK